MYNFGRYILFFITYSVIGTIAETLFRLITEHQLYGVHGFLSLPIFPIYGFGALLILLIYRRFKNPVMLFFVSIVLMVALEFFAHLLIEAIFNVRIWDYGDSPFSIHGRVRLDTAIGFGIAALLLVYVIHPKIKKLVERIPKKVSIIFAVLATTILVTNIIFSIYMRFTW